MKLRKDTVLSLVKGATVFINYLGACIEVIQGFMLSIPQPVAPFCWLTESIAAATYIHLLFPIPL